MKGWRILLFIFLTGGILFSSPSKEELQLFKQARQAQEDGLFDLSSQRASALFKKYPSTELRPETGLLQGRNDYYLGRFEEAIRGLQEGLKGVSEKTKPDYLYWLAESLLAAEKWAEAESRYRELMGLFPGDDLGKGAQLGLAWTLVKQEREAEARQILQNLIQSQGTGLIGQKAALLLGRFMIVRGNVKEAQQQLEALLQNSPRREVFYEACYWLGEVKAQSGRWKEAAEHYGKITGDSKSFPKDLVARAWFGLGQSLQGLKEQEKAMGAFEKAFSLGDSEMLKMAAFKQFLACGRAEKRLPEAIARLQEYVGKNQDKPNSVAALFAIALAQDENGEETKSVATLEALLIAYPQSRWKGAALLQLGRSCMRQDKPVEALRFFQRATEEGQEGVVVGQAWFEIGQIFYQRREYPQAQAAFEKALVGGGGLEEKALFNLLLVQSAAGGLEVFEKTEERFLKMTKNAALRDRVLMEKAALLQRLGKTEEARRVFEKGMGGVSPERLPVLQMKLADLLYREQNYEAASQMYEQIAAQFPQEAVFAEAAYKAVFSGYLLKKISLDQAVEALQVLWKKNEKHPMGVEILFSLAEFYFQKQDYSNAQSHFERLARDYPKSDLVAEAYYWAGKSAVGRNDLTSALAILEKIPDDAPQKVAARLLQGRIYHQQTRFENALQLFDAVLESQKQGDFFVEACLRKGDCQFALGSSDPARYEQASATYAMLLNSLQGNISQRNEAAYRRAKCFDKMNRKDEALALLMDVVQGRITSAGGTEKAPEFLWRVKAGLDAAEMKLANKDWKGALVVYKKLEEIGGPNQKEFRDAINRIKRENFIYDED